MRIFAVALDGPVCNLDHYIVTEIQNKFGAVPRIDIAKSTWPERMNLEKRSFDVNTLVSELYSTLELWNQPSCRNENVQEMIKWCTSGLVSSVFCDRDTNSRIVTETWLTINSVPYSNLLFDVGHKEAQLLHHVDASFYVTSDWYSAVDVALSGIRTYLIDSYVQRITDVNFKRYTEEGDDIARLNYVKSFKDITVMERI